jgi:glycogen operon protein
MERGGIYPTHQVGGFEVRAGHPMPLGISRAGGHGVNFAVFSRHATACTLALFREGDEAPCAELPFLPQFRVGHVFAMIVFGLNAPGAEPITGYAYRMDGPSAPERGHRFDQRRLLIDPYAPGLSGRARWNEPPLPPAAPGLDGLLPAAAGVPLRGLLRFDTFDWEGDRVQQRRPLEELVIYELHVRGFTRHPSAAVSAPGTFAGMAEKIDYLKGLGVNAVELMPIFEFDEQDNRRVNPLTGQRLVNYWGYNTMGFFAPKAAYASAPDNPQAELKGLVRSLHRAGVEVILDVVYNHTGEGDDGGPTFSFRGLDNKVYYLLDGRGRYLNFSGTGNTLNCNHPVVRQLVLDSLRHWASEYHIDGFRFDLASILGRGQSGEPLSNPPLLEQLAHDPVLADCKLIAEAWDAGGLYQVGRFPGFGRFAEWNGRYRDTMRRFLRGEAGLTRAVAHAVAGSPDLYGAQAPGSSINFITCHDGFSLRDLYTYERKRNEANGEQSRDGYDHNIGWNCGVEGPTDHADVLTLRGQMMRNAVALLMVSQGVPMLRMGDEVGLSTLGNNNPYCHDAPWNWFDWQQVEASANLLRFVRGMIGFRRAHPVLRQQVRLDGTDRVRSGHPDISWHGLQPWQPDWSPFCRTLAFMLDGNHVPGGDEDIYVAANMHWQPHSFTPPTQPPHLRWHLRVDTAASSPHDLRDAPGLPLPVGASVQVSARSVVILTARAVA